MGTGFTVLYLWQKIVMSNHTTEDEMHDQAAWSYANPYLRGITTSYTNDDNQFSYNLNILIDFSIYIYEY